MISTTPQKKFCKFSLHPIDFAFGVHDDMPVNVDSGVAATRKNNNVRYIFSKRSRLMKRQTTSSFFVAAAALATISLFSSSGHAVTVSVFPAYGPAPTSPSAAAYYSNAISALRGMSVPNRDNDPAGYELIGGGTISPGEVMVSNDFNSWRGKAAPTVGWDDGTTVTGAFSAQFGNAAYFGLCARVTDVATEDIKLEDLKGEIHWEMPTPFTQTLSFGPGTGSGPLPLYTPTRIGVRAGTDGMLGTPDDVVISSGSSSQLVDAIYLVGLADAIYVSQDTTRVGGINNQLDLDETVLKVQAIAPQTLTATYMIGGIMETGTVTLPEPATGGAFGLLLALFTLRRRRELL